MRPLSGIYSLRITGLLVALGIQGQREERWGGGEGGTEGGRVDDVRPKKRNCLFPVTV